MLPKSSNPFESQLIAESSDKPNAELLAEVKKVCEDCGLFEGLQPDIYEVDEDDSDEKTIFDFLNVGDCNKILAANLPLGYDEFNLDDKVEFINMLPAYLKGHLKEEAEGALNRNKRGFEEILQSLQTWENDDDGK